MDSRTGESSGVVLSVHFNTTFFHTTLSSQTHSYTHLFLSCLMIFIDIGISQSFISYTSLGSKTLYLHAFIYNPTPPSNVRICRARSKSDVLARNA